MASYIKNILNRLYLSLPDRPYLYLFYYQRTGHMLRLNSPQLFSHKIQWLKLHGGLERFAPFADKYLVRSYVGRLIGEAHLIPLLGVWDQPDDIDFAALPQQFVLKITTGCNFNYICTDKSKADKQKVRQLLNGWLKEDFYRQEREPQYRVRTSRIIAEKYLQDQTGGLRDYKIHCKHGEPQMVQVDTDRFSHHRTDCFTTEWQKINDLTPVTLTDSTEAIARPRTLPLMLELARKLSHGFPYVRVDLYSVGDQVYFGELTFTPGSGVARLPKSGDLKLGSYIELDAYTRPLDISFKVAGAEQ